MAPFSPIVCIVGFHHARGPEVEGWFGVEEGSDPASENEWHLLPFMALSDGAHASTEDFSYFTLRHEATPDQPATSLFGISCTRQLDANELINRPADVTRSTVQKAVVVISDSPHHFGQVREKLSVVTTAWFAQRDFTDLDILQKFQESLAKSFHDADDERDQYFGLSLRELIHEFKWQTLVLFKCCLLQPKMLFFGSHCERLCMMQFSLVSLIPGLIRNLQDCADPKFNSYEENLVMPTSLKTSERPSLLAYMGLPLQVFGKGSLFGPYTPLQQLDMLADHGTKSYIVGSTNSLLLQQKDRYSDILINLDEHTINVSSTSLRASLVLSTPDRRWIDFLTQAIHETWDESNPGRPKTMGYVGSEEFIRLQFEEYLLALLSAVKYRTYLQSHKDDENNLLTDFEGDPANEFGSDWIDAWMKTENFRIFDKYTDSHLFDIVDPKHPCSGGLTIEDVQRRLAQQVAELHLDERIQNSREVIGKQLAVGQKKISSTFNNLWADIEAMREAQRKRNEEHKVASSSDHSSPVGPMVRFPKAPDLSHAQASVQAASSRAGAYLSSWGTWASEKRKTGWGGKSTAPSTSPMNSPPLSVSAPGDIKRAVPLSKAADEKTTATPMPAAEVRERGASPS
ncbi:cytoplasm protein [Lepidopterella palustris CBS 459.81]|uniref:Cytoplasm protein n=1 Tax=Lepidopterella palustris CBS 459.81 TaxID=1314670 RepID=A0A8E2EI04_9PEZI|nr:cytoplasm protein [Lepidopterella palustris CBS 459.81]